MNETHHPQRKKLCETLRTARWEACKKSRESHDFLKGRPQCVLSLRLAVETASTLTVMVKRVTRLDAHQREVQLLAGVLKI